MLAAFLFWASSAAAAIDADGAQRLKGIVEKSLKVQQDFLTARGSRLVMDGSVMVEPAGSYYAVTLPHITIINARNEEIVVGMIAANAIPAEEPGQWKVTLAMPTPLIWRDAQKKQTLTLDIGKQSFAGVWNEKLANYTKLQAVYKDIKISFPAAGTAAALPEFTANYNLAEGANGLWSGPMRFTLNGLSVNQSDGSAARIGKIDATMKVVDYDPKVDIAYQEKMAALEESYKAGGGSTESSQHVHGVYNMIADYMSTVWDGYTLSGVIENIVLTRPPIPGAPAGSLRLDNAGFGIAMSGLRQDKATLQLKFGYNGFAMVPPPANFDRTTPAAVNIDMNIDNLPYKGMIALGRTAVDTASKNPEMAQMIILQTFMSLPQLASQSGTALTVNNIQFGNSDYNVMMSAKILANAQALLGATGKGHIEIQGIETLTDALAHDMQESQSNPAALEKFSQATKFMTVLQAVGQQGTNARQQPVRIYDLELTEKGQTLLNGTDIRVLLPPAAPDAAAPAAQKT